MKPTFALMTLIAIGAAASTASGAAPNLDVLIEASAPRGFAMRLPTAIAIPDGTRFHGAVCRRSRSPAPNRLRVERIGENGAVLVSASQQLFGLSLSQRHCATYDVVTPWKVTASDRFRICATRDAAPCDARVEP